MAEADIEAALEGGGAADDDVPGAGAVLPGDCEVSTGELIAPFGAGEGVVVPPGAVIAFEEAPMLLLEPALVPIFPGDEVVEGDTTGAVVAPAGAGLVDCAQAMPADKRIAVEASQIERMIVSYFEIGI